MIYAVGPASPGVSLTATSTYSASTGNLTSIATSDGSSLTYGYDGDMITSETLAGPVSGTVTRTYDNNFRVSAETVQGQAVSIGYDRDDLLTQLGAMTLTRDPNTGAVSATALGSVSDVRLYTQFGEPEDAETKYSGTSLMKVHFLRDKLGRIEEKTETVAGVTSVHAYSYDNAGRLWQVMKDGALTTTYLYDANGNRLSRSSPSGVENGIYDQQDRILTYEGRSFTFTPTGDLRTKTEVATGAVTSYSYDALGNLRRVELPDGRIVEYVIDPNNRRVGKKVNGALVRRWLYRGPLEVAAEIGAAGELSRFVGTQYFTKGTSTYRIVRDHLGSVRLVIDINTGGVAQRLDYDEFGRVLVDTNPGFQPFGFAGGLYDADTALVRFGSRDYDPQVGRWTSKDPIGFFGGDSNLYAYVLNDPINLIDPAGLDWLSTATDFSAGLGDALLLGFGDNLRDALGIGDAVDQCSGAYSAGGYASFALGAARLGYAAAAKGYSALASSGAAASAFRGQIRNAARLGFGREWRPPNLAGLSDDALRAKAGRTNPLVNAYGAGVGGAGASGGGGCRCR